MFMIFSFIYTIYNMSSLLSIMIKSVLTDFVFFKNYKNSMFIVDNKYLHYLYKLSSNVENAINNQIQVEQQASQNYLGIAVQFLHPTVSRKGCGSYFMTLYNEEILHMHNLIQYQLLRGGIPQIRSLQKPQLNENLTIIQALKQAFDVEKDVTQLLESIVKVAECEEDYQCADFIVTKFLSEQMKSINQLAIHITNVTRLGDDEHALYNYDSELLKSCLPHEK